MAAALWLAPQAGRAQSKPLAYGSQTANPAIRFAYPDTAQDAYLRRLRRENGLQQLTARAPQRRDQALLVSQWVHGLWRHSGRNEPSAPDALTIIREAKAGKNFRCVEYAKVTTDALLALGFKARVLALKTRDAETRRAGAGHVLTEVWLPEHRKWALLDAQFDLMPTLHQVPLSAVELQAAWVQNQPVSFIQAGGAAAPGRQRAYRRFVQRYLHFYEVAFDQRPTPAPGGPLQLAGKSGLMLVPAGSKPPAVFQRRFPLDYLLTTSSVADFYPTPE